MALAALCSVGLFPLPPGVCGPVSGGCPGSRDGPLPDMGPGRRNPAGDRPGPADPQRGGHPGHGSDGASPLCRYPSGKFFPSLLRRSGRGLLCRRRGLGRGNRSDQRQNSGDVLPQRPHFPARVCHPSLPPLCRPPRRAGAGGREQHHHHSGLHRPPGRGPLCPASHDLGSGRPLPDGRNQRKRGKAPATPGIHPQRGDDPAAAAV